MVDHGLEWEQTIVLGERKSFGASALWTHPKICSPQARTISSHVNGYLAFTLLFSSNFENLYSSSSDTADSPPASGATGPEVFTACLNHAFEKRCLLYGSNSGRGLMATHGCALRWQC